MFISRDPQSGELRLLFPADRSAPVEVPAKEKTIVVRAKATPQSKDKPTLTLLDFIRGYYPNWKADPGDDFAEAKMFCRIAREQRLTFDFTGLCSEIKRVSHDELD